MATEKNPETLAKSSKQKFEWNLLPDAWAPIKLRRGMLVLDFVLMAINSVARFVLPA